MALIEVARWFGGVWYRVTAAYPRRLPETPAQFERFMNVLVHAYGAPETPAAVATVIGMITSTPPMVARKSWGKIANAARRTAIHQMLEPYRAAAMATLQAERDAKLEAVAKSMKESHDKSSQAQQPNPDETPVSTQI